MPTGVYDRNHKLTDEERKTKRREYSQRSGVKAKAKKYDQTPKRKAKKKKYSQRPEIKAKIIDYRSINRFKVLQHYSKTLSNSDIPCCNCCGLDEHIDFLALDHITGRKNMDFESELVKLGYSSKLKDIKLLNWIIKNNFPDGFQVLCNNCNIAKGMKKNKNKCPHEIMEWNGQFDGTTAKRV
jgi:hypothetical protein